MAKTSPSEKKAKLSRKWFARLANSDIMEKNFKSIEKYIDSSDFEMQKLASDKLFKILPYIMPRESNGSASLININNGTQINGKGAEKILISLETYMKKRDSQVLALQKRNEELIQSTVQMKPIKLVEKKLPANSPLTQT